MNAHRPTAGSSRRSTRSVPTKLQPAEQARVREAADTLIFAADLDDARAAMADVDSLAEHLVASDRWSEERARQLVDDLLACGPVTAVG